MFRCRPPLAWLVALFACASSVVHSASLAPVAASHGMVVTAHQLATKVGVDVLKRGGNAVDAAVAVGYALAVVYPAAGNLGGGGFMTLQLADGRKTFIDFREKAPLRSTQTMYLKPDGTIDRSLTFFNSARYSSSVRPSLTSSVRMNPGATALTVIPCCPSSIANRRVMMDTAALVAA